MRNLSLAVFLLAAAFLSLTLGCQDTQAKPAALELSGKGPLDPTQVAQFRADYRQSKRAHAEKVMALRPLQAAAFWPVYDQYETQRVALGDETFRIVQDYRAKGANLAPTEAEALTNRYLEVAQKAQALIQTYHAKVAQATDSLVASRFVMMESQLQNTSNSYILSMLPVLTKG